MNSIIMDVKIEPYRKTQSANNCSSGSGGGNGSCSNCGGSCACGSVGSPGSCGGK